MTSASRPRVSVLLPVRNADAYLVEALDSVLAQSFTDFELLAHDDGSDDACWSILQAYAARDRRLCVSRAENRGIVWVLNRLAETAKGDYLARMDADDACLPERFALQVAFLDTHPDHVMVGGATLSIDEAGRPIAPIAAPEDHDAIDDRNLRGLTAIEHPTAMIRRAALEAVGGYDPRSQDAEDLDLWLRLAEIGRLANLPDVVLKYRTHPSSVSAIRQAEQAETTRDVCARARARRGVEAPFDYAPWRMEANRTSRLTFFLRYGWQAWRAGYRATWRHYALRALSVAPWSPDAWKLLVFGALRRPG